MICTVAVDYVLGVTGRAGWTPRQIRFDVVAYTNTK